MFIYKLNETREIRGFFVARCVSAGTLRFVGYRFGNIARIIRKTGEQSTSLFRQTIRVRFDGTKRGKLKLLVKHSSILVPLNRRTEDQSVIIRDYEEQVRCNIGRKKMEPRFSANKTTVKASKRSNNVPINLKNPRFDSTRYFPEFLHLPTLPWINSTPEKAAPEGW